MNLTDYKKNRIVETITKSAKKLIIENLIGDNHMVTIKLRNSSLLDVLKGKSSAEDISIKVRYDNAHDDLELNMREANNNKMLELCYFIQILEDDSSPLIEGYTNTLTIICGCQLKQFIEKFPVSSRTENNNNLSNVLQIWEGYIHDCSDTILEHLELDYPNDKTAENFSVCALENWNYASEGGGDCWIDELGDTHSEVIDNPEDILWFKSIARKCFENINL